MKDSHPLQSTSFADHPCNPCNFRPLPSVTLILPVESVFIGVHPSLNFLISALPPSVHPLETHNSQIMHYPFAITPLCRIPPILLNPNSLLWIENAINGKMPPWMSDSSPQQSKERQYPTSE